MSLLKFARLGHPVIREVAASLTQDEIGHETTQQIISDMIDSMRDGDGVGLAAPQVHVSKRIIIIEVRKNNTRYPDHPEVPLTVLVNPVIIASSETMEDGWEGCLSIPDFRGRVPRYTAVSVAAQDRHGEHVEVNAEGFFARVVQHEIDHLDGVVFLDRMHDLTTLTYLPEYQKYWNT